MGWETSKWVDDIIQHSAAYVQCDLLCTSALLPPNKPRLIQPCHSPSQPITLGQWVGARIWLPGCCLIAQGLSSASQLTAIQEAAIFTKWYSGTYGILQAWSNQYYLSLPHCSTTQEARLTYKSSLQETEPVPNYSKDLYIFFVEGSFIYSDSGTIMVTLAGWQ